MIGLDPIRVYLAASSKEVDRAEYWTTRLSSKNILITSTWLDDAKSIIGCNSPEHSHEDRLNAADECVAGVETADIIWVLMPIVGSMGAFWEFGYAHACQLATCISGAAQYNSVFSALAKYRFDTDQEAFDFITNTNMDQLYNDPS
jgi:hypothetical protein